MLPDIDYEQPQTALECVIVRALHTMKKEGYPDCTRARHCRIWRHLIKFAAERSMHSMTAQLYEDFLEAYEAASPLMGRALQGRVAPARQAMQSLMHFATYGVWKSRFSMKTRPVLPVSFAQDLHAYLEHLHERHLSPRTVRARRDVVEELSVFLESEGVTNWTDMAASQITAFFASRAHLNAVSLETRSYILRLFFRFLLATGKVGRDWSVHVPCFRRPRDQAVPVVWPRSSVDALLKSINRKSPCGKRDYAILLLAARLGMRAGDIRTLRLDSLRWDDERIEYTQGKTGRKTTLPLTEEVGTALIDYLLHGRPHSVHREVFLRAKAPYRPLSPAMDRIIKGRCRDAKVKLPPGHAGMHSLRHTLAQRLLSNETPLETIAGILGHTSLNATRVYAKVNLKQLRTAALDPEEVYHA